MKEILFRGKDILTLEWRYGFLSKSRQMAIKPYNLHLCIDFEEKGLMCSSIVIPDTVGQYTGVNDKCNRKIFEGDIFILEDVPKRKFIVKWNKEFSGYDCFNTETGFNPNEIIVVGNIYEKSSDKVI